MFQLWFKAGYQVKVTRSKFISKKKFSRVKNSNKEFPWPAIDIMDIDSNQNYFLSYSTNFT
jgi:hypothetical protein